jgi:hypothetical protein
MRAWAGLVSASPARVSFALRPLARRLGLSLTTRHGLLTRSTDLNAARLGRFTLREDQPQYAVLEGGLARIGRVRRWQLEAAGEPPAALLTEQVIPLLPLFFGLGLPADTQDSILDADVDGIRSLSVGMIGGVTEIRVIVDPWGWRPRRAGR